MKTQWFSLRTGSDVVVTREAGTAGAQETLDYIPGSALLGALIARQGVFAPELFLTGAIRCSDALPCAGRDIAWPMPLCYFRKKGEATSCATSALATGGILHGEQLRDGYVTAEGLRIDIQTTFRIKSGVDRTRFGTVKDGQLFGYEAIAAGQEFLFSLTCVDDTLLSSLAGLLSGPLRIGRSRSAEYGLVEVNPLERAPSLPSMQPAGDRHILYCISDVCLVKDGVFTTVPSPALFGLPEDWSLDLEATFIRTRSYSPWNAFHNRLLTQRTVICRGSVMGFRTNGSTASPPVMVEAAGVFVEEGLGNVMVDPGFVTAGVKFLEAGAKAAVSRGMKEDRNPSGNQLFAFMARGLREKLAAPEALKLGRKWARELLALQQKIEKTGQPVPGRTQWGFVRQLAIRSSGSLPDLKRALNELTQDTRKKWWTAEVKQAGKENSLHGCLVGLLSQAASDPVRRLALMHAAMAAGRGLSPKQEEGS